MRVLAVIVVLLSAVFARAHDLTVDVIRIIQTDSNTFVSLSLHKSDPLAINADGEIRKRLKIYQSGKLVKIGDQVSSTEKSEDLTYWQARLEGTTNAEFTLQGPFRPDRKDMTTVLLVFQNGLLSTQKTYKPEEKSESLGGFFRLGIDHLLNGLDHILFVLSLVLIAGRFKEIAKVITAFTVAHCCTLALVVLKGVTLSPRIVEPLIALSIAVVALQAFRKASVSVLSPPDPEGKSLADKNPKSSEAVYVAFGFGLIHGFGFAGGLIEKGFDRTNVWSALLSFNIGLELAQLSIAAIACATLLAVARNPKLQRNVTQIASLCFASLAVFWFVQRLIDAR